MLAFSYCVAVTLCCDSGCLIICLIWLVGTYVGAYLVLMLFVLLAFALDAFLN